MGMRLFLSLCLFLAFGRLVFSGSLGVGDALGSQRSWGELEAYQGAVTHDFFVDAMDRIYAPTANWRQWMAVREDGVWIEMGREVGVERMFLRFGESPRRSLAGRGLAGLRIVLDPGHIGGEWGPLEERSFSVAGGPLVQEGDLTLLVCKRIEARLRELGAEVLLTREAAEPVTDLRVADFLEEARSRLGSDEGSEALAEKLFYRAAEIRARGRRIAEWGGADLALAVHINASGFVDPEHPELQAGNDVHVLVNGCYLEGELADPIQRLELLRRLFEGYHLEEESLGTAMVEAMRESTGLPAYVYESGNAHPLDEDGYLWSRNLAANRVYDCPVVYLEPWKVNSGAVYEWAGAGDYEGEKEFDGEWRASLPAVYCDFVIAALERHFSGSR